MLDGDTLKRYFDSKLPEALSLLKCMVDINSFTGNREGVNRLGQLTAARFAPLGFEAKFVPSRNPAWGNHLVLTRPGSSSKTIAMVSHLDTVFPPEEEEQNNFRWFRESDRIFGPGTQDIKGGTVMMWLVLSALKQLAPAVFGSISWKLFWNSSEEQFSPDFGLVCRQHLGNGALAALVFEAEGRAGNQGLVVVARKGRASWRVTVRGRGAHAGSKHKQGANAIGQLAQTIQQIEKLTDYDHDLTFTAAVVRGGTVHNRVPHEAVVEGEFRAFDNETYQHAKSRLLALGGPGQVTSPVDGYRCEVLAEILTETRPWPRNPGTDHLCRIWLESGREVGIPIGSEQRGGLSDGNLLWDALPTIDGLGPWGDNDHCSERSDDGSKLPEFVDVTTFVGKAAVNTTAILRLVQQSGS
jgi:glutamate carboxypeptidase